MIKKSFLSTYEPPVIGIIICGTENRRQFVSEEYIHAIADSGGIPVIIPCTIPASSHNSLCHLSCPYIPFCYHSMLCNGFLFCGGGDITPFLFGEDSQTKNGQTDLRIDLFHLNLMKHILSLNRPVLAICRGMQILNLALGGTIYQDMSLCPFPTSNHIQTSSDRSDVCHKIRLLPDSLLWHAKRDTLYVNSFHHQCIHMPGEHLKITAVASDGVIEAVESTVHSFVLGVQWHPECMYDLYPSAKDIFTRFIQASSHTF